MTDISLVAPCLNEEDNIPLLVERFMAEARVRRVDVEIVLVDDGSTDGTWDAMEKERMRRGTSIVTVRHGSNQGIPHAWLSGVSSSTGETVCLIDSDLQNPPEAVFDLYSRFLSGDCQMVRGVRQQVSAQPRTRVIMSRSLNTVLNLTFGMKSRDNKSGFVLASRSTMSRVVRHRGHYRHFQTFIGVAAHSLGLNVAEVDTPFNDRASGFSFLTGRSRRVIFEVFRDIPEAAREYGWRFGRKRASR